LYAIAVVVAVVLVVAVILTVVVVVAVAAVVVVVVLAVVVIVAVALIVTINRQKATATSNNTDMGMHSDGNSVVLLTVTANKKLKYLSTGSNSKQHCDRNWHSIINFDSSRDAATYISKLTINRQKVTATSNSDGDNIVSLAVTANF